MAPAPLAVERSCTTDLYPCPPSGRERWHHSSNTHSHTHSYSHYCDTHPFLTTPPPFPLTQPNATQPMVYFPASTPVQHPPFIFFSSFSTLVKVARQQRKTSHTHTPHYASEGFPDVLVYIMECAGRREADSEPPWLCLCKSYTDLHSSGVNANTYGGPAVALSLLK